MTRTEATARYTATAIGLLMAAIVLVAVAATAEPFQPDALGPGQDARAYWAASTGDPYAPGSVGRESAYLYSPAFLQAVAPLQILPWTTFAVLWTALLLAVLYWLVGPVLLGPTVVLTLPELWGGNVTILMAAALVLGFRWAGTWAFMMLTKVTPGLGLLWFAVRREWRSLAWALSVTGAVVALSFAAAPDQWREWISLLASSGGSSTVPGSIPIPLVVRLPVAIVVIAHAAVTDRRWLLPVGALLAMPVIWWGSFAMLAASVAMRRHEIEAALLGRLSLSSRGIGSLPAAGRPGGG